MNVAGDIARAFGLSRNATATAEKAFDIAKLVYGDFGGIADAIKRQDYGDLAEIGIMTLAKAIGVVNPALATAAPMIAGFIIWAAHHPEAVESPAMTKAAGAGGGAIFNTEGMNP